MIFIFDLVICFIIKVIVCFFFISIFQIVRWVKGDKIYGLEKDFVYTFGFDKDFVLGML